MTYAYGQVYDPTICNTEGKGGTVAVQDELGGCVSPAGHVHVVGNVAEWLDACRPEKSYCKWAGGGWYSNDPRNFATCDVPCAGNTMDFRAPALGARCCRTVQEDERRADTHDVEDLMDTL